MLTENEKNEILNLPGLRSQEDVTKSSQLQQPHPAKTEREIRLEKALRYLRTLFIEGEISMYIDRQLKS